MISTVVFLAYYISIVNWTQFCKDASYIHNRVGRIQKIGKWNAQMLWWIWLELPQLPSLSINKKYESGRVLNFGNSHRLSSSFLSFFSIFVKFCWLVLVLGRSLGYTWKSVENSVAFHALPYNSHVLSLLRSEIVFSTSWIVFFFFFAKQWVGFWVCFSLYWSFGRKFQSARRKGQVSLTVAVLPYIALRTSL